MKSLPMRKPSAMHGTAMSTVTSGDESPDAEDSDRAPARTTA